MILVTDTAHTELKTSRAQPTHSLDSASFFLKPCAGTRNISRSYIHWGFRMTLVAMNNEAAWHPGEGISFFIWSKAEEFLGPLYYVADAPLLSKSCEYRGYYENGIL